MRATLDRSTMMFSCDVIEDIFDFSASLALRSTCKIILVTWFDIASKDFSREMFQTLRRTILIIELTENCLPIDAYHILL
eukprot:scaffold15397_cov89-Skeletonema_dohrnii-CCMP3373.AAC.2